MKKPFCAVLAALARQAVGAGLTARGLPDEVPPDAQEKVRAALTRILNEGDGGMICILL